MTETPRFKIKLPAWNANWQSWQPVFEDFANNIDSNMFAIMSNMNLIIKTLPNVEIRNTGNWVLSVYSDAVFISRNLLTEIRVSAIELELTPNSIIGISLTPGAVGAQSTEFEVYDQSIDNAPEIVPIGYIDSAYNIIWYNGSQLIAGSGVNILFNLNGGGGGGLLTIDEAYDVYGSNPAIVTIDGTEGQGDLTFKPTDEYSFNIDLSNTTNISDGFQVYDGVSTEYWRLIRKADNVINLESQLASVYNVTSGTYRIESGGNLQVGSTGGMSAFSGESVIIGVLSGDLRLLGDGVNSIDIANAGSVIYFNSDTLDVNVTSEFSIDAVTASNLIVSGATEDLTIGARGTTINLNELGDESLSGYTKTSIIGALNEVRILTFDDIYDNESGAHNIVMDDGIIDFQCSTVNNFQIDISSSSAPPLESPINYGFKVIDGTDIFLLGHNGTNQMSLRANLHDITCSCSNNVLFTIAGYLSFDCTDSISLDSESTINIDSGTSQYVDINNGFKVASGGASDKHIGIGVSPNSYCLVEIDATSNGDGTNLYGMEIIPRAGVSVDGDLYGLRVRPQADNPSTVGNVICLDIAPISGGSTVTNYHGIKISGITGGSNNYNISAEDSGAYNYFAGNVGIKDSTPSQALEVTGNILVTDGNNWIGIGASPSASDGIALVGSVSGDYLKISQGVDPNDNNTCIQVSNGATSNDLINLKDNSTSVFIVKDGGNVAIGNITASYKLSIGSADNSNQIGIYHNNTDAYFRTDDGSFIFQTDEGTNTNTTLSVIGKGSGYGILQSDRVGVGVTPSYSLDVTTNMASFNLQSTGAGAGDGPTLRIVKGHDSQTSSWQWYGAGGISWNITHTPTDNDIIYYNSTGLNVLELYNSSGSVSLFSGSLSGDTRQLSIYGYRSGDALRSLNIGSGVHYSDTGSFSGLSNYYFDGQLIAKSSSNDGSTNAILLRDSDSASISYINSDGTFQNSGGRIVNIRNISSSTADLATTDYILHATYTSTGAVTITLLSAQVVSGRYFIIVDAGGNSSANNITIDTQGSETINGNSSLVIGTDYVWVYIYSDGSNWFAYGG